MELAVNGVKIIVINGDITEARADSIVNAANRFLQHGGGVALALVRRGGRIVQQESDDFVERHGPLKRGEVAVTTAGNLSAKRIIHTVGPVYGEGKLDELVDAYASAIAASDTYNDTALALPAISAGTYGFPVEDSARAMLSAVKKLKLNSLKEIYVYVLDKGQYRKMVNALAER
ncbi:MAG: macro domain-containing protein [Nitrososphaerota archaeon]|nr:macro domain-containing protein [Nitrososphaerota archaeon]MDG6929751.1 macro domain-containing protein [Nitrososphaerota archaeon]MDG6931390.1 macro domain-containing protein [Nitrososphaerota archaeon]MDG6935371.1 macro domain-containing protein [Nitrososphaerota archaeon]MDG6944690.1 macro domain-containing protein [Nitrososphaerota archaeon]